MQKILVMEKEGRKMGRERRERRQPDTGIQ